MAGETKGLIVDSLVRLEEKARKMVLDNNIRMRYGP
jgi:hypothetical protein